MKRKIYNDLIKWKEQTSHKPLMILGVRQCGKTYIINEFCQNEYKNVVQINLLQRDDIVKLYETDLTSDEKFNRLKLILNSELEAEDTIFFIDEIQVSERLIAELKYFCECHPKMNIICAGSLLGVKLNRSRSTFPVGKVKMLNLYPMDFEEFLIALEQNMLLDYIKECYNANKQMGEALHEKAMNLYRCYMVTGGMPESVKNFVSANFDYINYDTNILKDILESYFNDMNKYVIGDAEALKIRALYNSLPSQLLNLSSKFQYSNISKDARSRDYATSLAWLEASNMVLKCKCVKMPSIPLEGYIDENVFKLYLSDVGILNAMLDIKALDVLNDNLSLYKGIMVENYVATQLVAKGYRLYYWKNSNTSEVDFILYTDEGIIPVEVKAGKSTQAKSLSVYSNLYNPKYAIRISAKDFGYNPETKIKSVPLYAVFLI